ncbi:methyltransferase-endonuclease [Yersinia enterocolitica]|uniref:site-specific DNA-methyltransferase (adenine-specific) n=2 Tax=Yersinia enterocolitica TaxID=630 RepID=Q8VLS0_YEREN|nr:BsuBI/PstI family type II restriction endonuclease [Yersinia enterocolitica]AJI82554.1 bsuBI/PstI restriction endonuclease family protein [Yersinia enterocolitica]AJJ24579.1 bsuBI/PstI restriction endonuclease family protein [Yersinia enterocolitica]EKA27593.1 methyltransferase-endonuclease [Yersinia enterocolitica subsp. enterocolitica WA-314]ELI8284869.1 Eco57I restriction-modification methylase domain-containing protein [Yersinia enterocolitica]KGA71495.1 bsuBI/PstI restriction endonucle
MLEEVDEIRVKANANLDVNKKGELGQFFTSSSICIFMASLFNELKGDISLLDPGCGPGSLTAAFTEEVIRRGSARSLELHAIDIERKIKPFLDVVLDKCVSASNAAGIKCKIYPQINDYITAASVTKHDFGTEMYTHCIINPPYKKITSASDYRKILSAIGIEAVNLYAGFVALAIMQLKKQGEMVAIIPRSFCNGPYYLPFRNFIFQHCAIKHVHIFDSRSHAFSEDDVLQENIIIHLVKNGIQESVKITSSPNSDFFFDQESNSVSASDMTVRNIPFESLVNMLDKDKFIHIAANNRDQSIIDRLNVFYTSLNELGISVSTGPVVDFRLKSDLRENIEPGAVPLIYPVHLNGVVDWPKKSKKPNAINVSERSRSWLWSNQGYFVIVRRFSSKEEKRRIVATVYDGSLPGEWIGFENKLNVFHINKSGMDKDIAYGLSAFLNSMLLDKYYRLFGGHTQINATDLRSLHYPDRKSLQRIGSYISSQGLSQENINEAINTEIKRLSKNDDKNPLAAQEKLDQALEIITLLGMPKSQQNERSALTFLALVNLRPEGSWQELEKPLVGVTPIMDWCRDIYGKEYAPNTRETFRRQTLHQFIDGGLVLYNPDKPNRAVNSPKACYQIAPELFDVLNTYGTPLWNKALGEWLMQRETLVEQYAMKREMHMIPLTIDNGTEIHLSPGDHSQLIHDIVTEFGPRFAPGSQVIYLGDTGAKEDFFRKDALADLGVTVNRKGKLPDVVLYWPQRDWLILIESVTSHGPVDGKRHSELANLFKDARPGLVYVSAFPDKKTMSKFFSEISWETEVWIAEAPTHMIHLNGDRFLGPHN